MPSRGVAAPRRAGPRGRAPARPLCGLPPAPIRVPCSARTAICGADACVPARVRPRQLQLLAAGVHLGLPWGAAGAMDGTLNYTMRTPHTQKTPTDTQLEFFADYIVHAERALSSLPTHVSEQQGAIYRGIRVLLDPKLYSPGKQFTWQAFSSATSKQVATLDFVQVLPGRKLSGSLFVIHSITAKDIRHFSAFPSEEEVLFPPNSQFKVDRVVTSAPDKAALLSDLSAYDLTDLHVYVIMQVA